jgi:ABC-type lipoprotein release transport system permease subunit
LVRFNKKVSPKVADRSLHRIASSLDTLEGGAVGVLLYNDLLPAEIINYKTMGSIPTLLAFGVAAGAVAALGLTLTASVRRRRRDLALLKTLGFTRRKLASTVGWQSTVTAVIGTIIGIPLGLALGSSLWDLFAREIYVVPAPTLPVLQVTLVAIGGIVLANVVAGIPGRSAAGTPAALVLRAE